MSQQPTPSSSNEQTPLLTDGVDPSKLPPLPHSLDDETNLNKFRKAIGINEHAENGDLESARRSARGLYREIINHQKWRSRQYLFVDAVYYFALSAQILIGATLAALGPGSNLHNTAITILGVVNASTAGVLALLKGQGLPERLRKDQFEMRKVQDFIEETEIKLGIAGDELTKEELENIVNMIFEKYNTARDTAEMNNPASYAHQSETDLHQGDGAGDNTPRRNIVSKIGDGKGKARVKYVID
ncbi:hypothetical protein B0J14DRAFT_503793 [Halenospora varia]|nr:hypothetical protein B0J14DRAFT_503793 [Halenospora varia]